MEKNIILIIKVFRFNIIPRRNINYFFFGGGGEEGEVDISLRQIREKVWQKMFCTYQLKSLKGLQIFQETNSKCVKKILDISFI